MAEENLMEKIVSLCKRRGFVFQGSEIYGGLAGTWDYGPLGVVLKKNIEGLWWKRFVDGRDDIYAIDAAILMHPKVWEASGHVAGFSDPMVECKDCGERLRFDNYPNEIPKEVQAHMDKHGLRGQNQLDFFSVPRQFNMMFQTQIGASEGSITYLRPETAGGMFVNFKNILDTFHPKLPFGMAQIGKAFRNEIAPRDFIFRVRELEQMEIEYFVRPADWETYFKEFEKAQIDFLTEDLGLARSKIHPIEVPAADRAHYSKHSVDTEFDFPFGQKELLGLAYRTDYDLSAHTKASGVDLSYWDEDAKERFTPHVIEPTFGLGRLLLAVISDAYTEDELGGEKRVFLKLPPRLAPIKAAVFPLLKNKPELVGKAREIFLALKKEIPNIVWDDNGNIGKRYRRQDEVGTPFCITVDFDTLGEKPELKDTVTLRHRDSGQQERVATAQVAAYIKARL